MRVADRIRQQFAAAEKESGAKICAILLHPLIVRRLLQEEGRNFQLEVPILPFLGLVAPMEFVYRSNQKSDA